MLRTILAVIVGYVAMVIVVFAFSTATWFALGQDFAYEGDTWLTTMPWTMMALGAGLIAAVLGGLVAAKVGKTPRAVRAMALFVLILGLAMGVPAFLAEAKPAEVRPAGEIGLADAMSESIVPKWYYLVVPLVGAFGAMLGGRILLGSCVMPGGL